MSTDAYTLDAADVQDPPRTLAGKLRYLGPGMLISASVVGAGELILTTTLGAQAGFVLLWMVILAATVKVWVQLELATWTILTGRTAMEGYNRIGPRRRGVGWIIAVWVMSDIPRLLQRGALIGGAAAAASILLPLWGESLSRTSLVLWTVLLTAAVVAVLVANRYALIERIATYAVFGFTVVTVFLAVILPTTPFGYGLGDIASGLTLTMPVGLLGIAIAMFGITGIGADEMTSYSYWCLEKGYARWTGEDDGSPERRARAHGWISVMRLDVLVSWAVTTVCTLSFFVIGAAVLHPQDLVPQGNEVISTLSRMYTDTLGPWAELMFVGGALVILLSTVLAVGASVPRLWSNVLGIIGLIDFHDARQRARAIRILSVLVPSLWAVSYLVVQSPVLMLQIGGTASALFLVAIVIAVWKLRYTDVPAEFRSNHVFTVALAFSSAAILALGIYIFLDTFGFL
ncbi:Nramp family divalent metal transporter [Pseudonocardia nematodicida]|uniref:Nramp family divalent metal transporter n=1 Tax=Pseudonocardia nematodicida TaxID=1206997 RepID=A0ABV1K715_9PSEU